MRTGSRYIFLGGLGGAMYYCIEILFRGYSHWSMFLLGGLCFLYCGTQNNGEKRQQPLWRQVARCTAFITVSEFLTGVWVNLIMGWAVWDYSDLPFHVLGQVCLPFAMIFTVFGLAAIVLEDYLSYWMYGTEKPVYIYKVHTRNEAPNMGSVQ